jgi:hypothetical protein
MKRRAWISGTVILLLLAVTVIGQRSRGDDQSGPASKEDRAAGTQWEYLVVAGGHANLSTEGNEQYGSMRKQPDGAFSREWFPLERNLDKLGARGWELVAVGGSPNDPVFYLKRPRGASR